MRKTFELTHLKIKRPRLVEAVRRDVKKYLKRERNKTLPPGVDYWDFNCKFGHSEQEAREIHVSQISKCIDEVDRESLTSFYLEILATEGVRNKAELPDKTSADSVA